jgi:hypothetical protein
MNCTTTGVFFSFYSVHVFLVFLQAATAIAGRHHIFCCQLLSYCFVVASALNRLFVIPYTEVLVWKHGNKGILLITRRN